MKKIKSIGLIETLGMVGAIEAADAALKAANVECLGYELNKAGYVTIKLSGDVAAVQAGVSSGAATAARIGELVATHVLPRPDEQVVEVFVRSGDNVPSLAEPKKEDPEAEEKSSAPPPPKKQSAKRGGRRGSRQTTKTQKPAPKPPTPEKQVEKKDEPTGTQKSDKDKPGPGEPDKA